MTSLFRLTHPTATAAFAGIPGPEPSLPLGTAGDFASGWPWEVCAEYGRAYGGMAVIWLLGTPALVLNDPGLIGTVLDTDAVSYYKDAPHDAVAPIIGENDLFVANGETWAGLRRLAPLARPVARDWLTAQIPVVRRVVLDAIAGSLAAPTKDLIEPLRRIVYDAISAAVWGEPLGDDNYHEFMKMARVGHGRMVEPPVLQKIPPLDPFFYVDRSRWTATYGNRLMEARKRGAPAGSLLQRLLEVGPEMSDEDLAHALSAPTYFGGVFSTAAAIAHTLRLLGDHPAAQGDVLRELTDREPLSPAFDAAALTACEYLDRAIRESLRLSPPVPLFFRNVLKDRSAVLGGRTLPPNTLIFMTNWLLHRDSAHWVNPENYNPDRWTNGGAARDPLGSGFFFPFGRGPRTCVGQEFALFLMKTILAVLLARSRTVLDLTHPPETDFFFAVQHPKHQRAVFEMK